MMNPKEEPRPFSIVPLPRPPRPTTPLPPISHCITMADYLLLENTKFHKTATRAPKIKKVLLSLLKDRPEIWDRKAQFSAKNWQNLGVEVYERTGYIVRSNDLHKMLRTAKVVLKNKLRTCIGIKKLDRAATETELWKWEYYPHFIYYRETLGHFEANLRGEPWDGEAHIDDDDDDIIYEGYWEADKNSSKLTSETQDSVDETIVEEVPLEPDTNVFDREEEVVTFRRPEAFARAVDNHFGPPTEHLPDSSAKIYSTNIKSASCAPESTEPPKSDNSAQHIGEQVHRLFAQYPERSKLFRETLFKTILALEEPEYEHAAEVFTDLAQSETAKRRRRSEATWQNGQ